PRQPLAIRELLAEHLVRPVRFADEIEAMYAAGAHLFVEIGPRNVLTGLASQILGERPHVAIAVDLPRRSMSTQLQHALGQLAAHGVPVKLDRLFQGRAVRRLDFGRLVEQTAEKPLPPTTWLVNGGRARPVHESGGPSRRPVKLMHVQEPGSMGDGEMGSQGAQEMHPSTPAPLNPRTLAQDGAEQVMIQFEHLMDRFLETQRNIMRAYLQVTPAVAPPLQPFQPAALLAGRSASRPAATELSAPVPGQPEGDMPLAAES
ncbi:unnamed protein product, partial [marine sediment metagenome]